MWCNQAGKLLHQGISLRQLRHCGQHRYHDGIQDWYLPLIGSCVHGASNLIPPAATPVFSSQISEQDQRAFIDIIHAQIPG